MYGKDEIDIRSKDNVTKNGEVFTPTVIVDKMIDLIDPKFWTNRSAVVIEPTCGNGQFLVRIFDRKIKGGLTIIESLNTIIGMDISEDNIQDSRMRLYDCACNQMRVNGIEKDSKEWKETAIKIVCIVCNNIMKVKDSLKVINEYGQGKGILANAKFVYDDPTGNGEVMPKVSKDALEAKAKEAFKKHKAGIKSRTLAPFFAGE